MALVLKAFVKSSSVRKDYTPYGKRVC
jgi:hypothetical protein